MRRNTAKLTDKQERQMLRNFLIIHMEYAPTQHAFVDDVFESYKSFCEEMGGFKTEMSLDSFGRLLPKNIERTRLFVKGERFRKAFIDWRLK